jgi:two-component system nitrogen regulation sensor histidine kinase GlnL
MAAVDRIWASLPLPALVLDGDDRIQHINPAAEVFLNTTIRTVAGERVDDRLAIDLDVREPIARVRQNSSPLFVNDVHVGTGERAPVQCNLQIAPLADEADRVLFLVSPREIAGRLGRSLSAESAAKSAIGMAEMLAHEIKNPLAGITGAAQLLSMNLAEGDRELCDLIVAETRRVVKLLEQVEEFGNLRPPNCAPVNLHDLLERARKTAAVGFAAHMTFREDYDPSLPPAWADGDQLLQVFQNLMKNAAQAAGREGGTIRLHTFYEPSLRVRRRQRAPISVPLQVEIVDDGPGLPPDIAEDVFEPFVSGRENGTGLGLALVSKVIAAHDAWITVDSVPGRTAFRLSLPRAPEGAVPDDHEETR